MKTKELAFKITRFIMDYDKNLTSLSEWQIENRVAQIIDYTLNTIENTPKITPSPPPQSWYDEDWKEEKE